MKAEAYLTRQLIPYIGNKRRLLPFLDGVFDELEREHPVEVFLDPFAGSGAVCRLARVRGWEVLANDWEPYSAPLNFAHLCVEESELPGLFRDRGGIEAVLAELNSLPPPSQRRRYIAPHFAPRDTEAADYRRERLFYTAENALRIDAVRDRIEAWYPGPPADAGPAKSVLLAALLLEAATHANTSGVFKACHKGFGGHSGEALGRILAPVTLEAPVLIDGARPARVFAEDATAFVRGRAADLCYLDPPYNQHQYGSNYHLLNTITLWDRPPVSEDLGADGRLLRKAAIRGDWTRTRSPYCVRGRAAAALRELLEAVDARWIVLSYNSDGIIPLAELRELLEARGAARLRASGYVKYRGGRQSAAREIHNLELLWIVESGRSTTRAARARIGARLASERLRLLLRGSFAPERVRALLGGQEGWCEPVAGIRLPMAGLYRLDDPRAALAALAGLPSETLAAAEGRLAAALCADRTEELQVVAVLLARWPEGPQATGLGRRALWLLRKLAHRKHAAAFAAGAAALRELARSRPALLFVEDGVSVLERLLEARLAG